MGRPERRLDPDDGILQQFALDLRGLREEAGSPAYRRLAERCTYSATSLADAAGGRRLPTLDVALAFAEACGGDRAEWERRWHRAVARLYTGAEPSASDDEAPYLGLASYQERDASRYFGREQLLGELISLLARRRLIAVVGPSGSGKSSLLRAGLVPAIRDGLLPSQASGWRADVCAVRTPGPHPRPHPRPDGAAAPGGERVLVVDQFEEVFTLCRDPAERTGFIEWLLDVDRGDDRTRVVLGVRADFFGRCCEHDGLAAALGEASLLVAPMAAEQLRQVIVKPASRVGLMVEPGLVATVVRDAGTEPGALPLVSHALLETWRRHRGKALTVAGYEAAGGLHGAIARTAERAYGELSPDRRGLARHVLLQLVTPGEGTEDTRRPVPLSELGGDDPAAAARIVRQLAQARLLTLDRDASGGEQVQIAHEALIRSWPRLRKWLDEDRDGIRIHRRLTEAAKAWEDGGHDISAVYRGATLATVREWADRNGNHARLNALDAAFLQAGIAAERAELAAARQRRRLVNALAVTLSVLLVVSVGAATVAFHERGDAIAQQRQARSRQLATEARVAAPTDVARAASLAARAYRVWPTVEARGSLLSLAGYRAYDARLTGHIGAVQSVAFSPDGKHLVSGGEDALVHVWDVARGVQTAALRGHAAPVRAVVFSPDGRRLATAGKDRTIIVWDTTGWRRLRTLHGHTAMIADVAFSPDGRQIAAVSADHAVTVWRTDTGTVAARLTGHGGTLSKIAFRPDGRTLAIAGDDGMVTLWQPRHDGRVRELNVAGSNVYAVAFSPDGRTLAAAGEDQAVTLWDPDRGTRLATLYGHSGPIRDLTFSPDGTTLASASNDGTIGLWDPDRRTHITDLTGATSVLPAVAISPDDRTIAAGSGDGPILLWDRRGRPFLGHGAPVFAARYSPDGVRLASIGQDCTLRLWDPETRAPQAVLPACKAPADPTRGPDVGDLAFSPTGHLLATVTNRDSAVRLWTTTGYGEPAGTLDGRRPLVKVAIAPGGRLLADAREDGAIQLWDLPHRTSLATIRPSRALPGALAFGPDGRFLATGGDDGHITLIDLRHHDRMTTLPGHTGGINALAFSPDGTHLATAGGDRRIHLWNLTGHATPTTLGTTTAAARAIAYSPDGRFLATGGYDRKVSIWDLEHHTLWATLTGHTDAIADLGFSPDGTRLISASDDHTIIPWALDPQAALDHPE